ncbi:MAG: acylphosphatase [Actinobacteria bacterium]|nr:acylphosphatase [Actinomycetota bacterium]
MKRVRVIVSGLVQGVFFRATCVSLARERDLGGFVRNLPDGRLEAAFEGPSERVDELVDWCRRGPDLARVDHIDVVDEALVGDVGFRVTH